DFASLFDSCAPLTASQAAFICARPQIFETPLRVNVRASELPAQLDGRSALKQNSRKTSSTMIANPRSAQIALNFSASARCVKCPVGLLGCTTTTALVRGVIACSNA